MHTGALKKCYEFVVVKCTVYSSHEGEGGKGTQQIFTVGGSAQISNPFTFHSKCTLS